MGVFISAFNHIRNDRWKLVDQALLRFGKFLPDRLYLRLRYRAVMGYWPNFSDPRTFQEKINWLKLNNKNPLYTDLVDKYSVKAYVGEKIGEQYIVPTIAIWDTPRDIVWEQLPKKFVLKTTHGGGGNSVIICRDKSTLDIYSVMQRLEKCMKKNIYHSFREWPYKNVRSRIIAEVLLEEKDSEGTHIMDLWDYKFYCFNGEPRYCQVIRNRRTKETIDFYDMEWKHQCFVGLNPSCMNGEVGVPKPPCLSEMKSICEILSKGIPFVRVDLYVISGHIYFGELTFFPAGGFGRFKPDEWNIKMGELIDIVE